MRAYFHQIANVLRLKSYSPEAGKVVKVANIKKAREIGLFEMNCC